MEKQIPDENKKVDCKSHKRLIILVSILLLILAFILFRIFTMGGGPGPGIDAGTVTHLREIGSEALVYHNSNTYIGFDKSAEYTEICEEIAKNTGGKSSCSAQINEKSYCIKAKLLLSSKDARDYCVDRNYEGLVSGEYCTPEKPYCTELPSLPQGYTLNDYSVEKKLDTVCQKHTDCATPAEYSIQSRCPFVSLCLEGSCTVVCPAQEN